MPKTATEIERAQHESDRAFYDMTGGKNIFSYMTTREKLNGEFTMFDYLQKNTGLFNQGGVIPKDEIRDMKARLKENKGNIWHGFISLSEEDSPKIDTPEKCIGLVKQTFGEFFKDAHLGPKNMDLMCALHLDKPKHLHIHFVFWEKEPKYKDDHGEMQYRAKGKISKPAIDNMFVRLGLFVDDGKDRLYKSRDEAVRELRGMTAIKVVTTTSEEIKKEIVALAKDLPLAGRLSYGSKDMEPFRGRVDKIVQMLLDYDWEARSADKRFYAALEERKRAIKNICNQPYVFTNKNIAEEILQRDLPTYHHTIDDSNIKIIENIEADYKRRQGNLVINLAKFIKPDVFMRSGKKKYKVNDNRLKRALGISTKNVNRSFKKFLSSFGQESRLLERDFTNRLHEIEEEIKQEKKKDKKEGENKT